jgi:uncharacterized protein (TIRG00374 family)
MKKLDISAYLLQKGLDHQFIIISMKPILQRLRHSGSLQLFAKVIVTLFVMWLVFHNVDFLALQTVLQKQDHTLIVISGGFLLLQMLIGSVRWHMIIRTLVADVKVQIPTRLAALKIYYISMFFTCCLPGAVGGDVIRVWLAKAEHLSLPVSINSVIIDRMMALVALVLMLIVSIPLLAHSLGFNVMMALPLIGGGAVFGLWFLYHAETLLDRFRHFRLVHWVLYLIGNIRMITSSPYICAVALVMAVAGHMLYAASAWALAYSLHIDMTLFQSMTLMPPVMLATMLPISIGGWGVREVGVIGMLAMIGIPQSAALVFSIQLGLINIIVFLPASILWLAQRRHQVQPLSDMNHAVMKAGL